jgi:hypothetical protein
MVGRAGEEEGGVDKGVRGGVGEKGEGGGIPAWGLGGS